MSRLIEPNEIDTSKHLWGAFGHYETEASAGWIVRYCQDLGIWKPFTYEAINNFYEKNSRHRGFDFNRLIADGYVIEGQKWYTLTELFVAKCYASQFSNTPVTPLVEPHASCAACAGSDVEYGRCGVCRGGDRE